MKMDPEPQLFTLFHRTTKLGTIEIESFDFPNVTGAFIRHPSLLKFENGEIMNALIDYSIKSAALLDDGLSTDELDRQYADKMSAFSEAAKSNDWCMIDGDGTEKQILAPNFQADGGLVWRWN